MRPDTITLNCVIEAAVMQFQITMERNLLMMQLPYLNHMIQAHRKLIKSGKAIVAVLSKVVRLIHIIVHRTNSLYKKW